MGPDGRGVEVCMTKFLSRCAVVLKALRKLERVLFSNLRWTGNGTGLVDDHRTHKSSTETIPFPLSWDPDALAGDYEQASIVAARVDPLPKTIHQERWATPQGGDSG